MFRKIDDFTDSFKQESESTLKIFNNITDESLNQRVYSDGRTIADLAWHITVCLGEMLTSSGFKVDAPDEKSEPPKDIQTIINTYDKVSKSVFSEIPANWTDEMLLDEMDMYGEKWKRGFMLFGFILHEVHHRAQLTVLMRQAGLKVPGPYGPAKEEWAAYGMQAPKY